MKTTMVNIQSCYHQLQSLIACSKQICTLQAIKDLRGKLKILSYSTIITITIFYYHNSNNCTNRHGFACQNFAPHIFEQIISIRAVVSYPQFWLSQVVPSTKFLASYSKMEWLVVTVFQKELELEIECEGQLIGNYQVEGNIIHFRFSQVSTLPLTNSLALSAVRGHSN